MIETDRLVLREYTMDDFEALYEILSDPETMQHYPAPFDAERTAMANGMRKIKEYPDTKNTISYVYAITRDEWNAIRS